jgi:sodium/potassium-transporting ATPase subunit alpha
VEWSESDGDNVTDDTCKFVNDNGDCVYYDERIRILKHAQTAFLTAIVICQIGCGVACKTRLLSIVDHGFRNFFKNMSFLQEIGLIICLVYVPFLNVAFGTSGTRIEDWAIAIPFAFAILAYDETRKYIMRSVGETHWFYRYFFF